MDNSLSRGATDWREGRRFRAFELKQQGWSQQRIAEALGVSKKGAVSQWMKRARDGGGVEALKRRPAPGARPRLSEEQRAKVPKLLARELRLLGKACRNPSAELSSGMRRPSTIGMTRSGLL
jgi:transposase